MLIKRIERKRWSLIALLFFRRSAALSKIERSFYVITCLSAFPSGDCSTWQTLAPLTCSYNRHDKGGFSYFYGSKITEYDLIRLNYKTSCIFNRTVLIEREAERAGNRKRLQVVRESRVHSVSPHLLLLLLLLSTFALLHFSSHICSYAREYVCTYIYIYIHMYVHQYIQRIYRYKVLQLDFEIRRKL